MDTNINTGTQGGGTQFHLPVGTPLPGTTGTQKTQEGQPTQGTATVDQMEQFDALFGVLNSTVKLTTASGNPANPVLPPPTNDSPAVGANALKSLYNFTSPNALNIYSNYLNGVTTPPPATPEEVAMKVTDPEILKYAKDNGLVPGQVYHAIQRETNFFISTELSKLPKGDADKILFALNNPEGAKNLSPELKTKLNDILNKANQSVGEEYKFTSSWEGAPIDTESFNNKLSNEYDYQFEQALQAAFDNGTITEDQFDSLKNLHYSPENVAGAPTQLQTLLKQIEGQVIAQLQQQYGFDDGWSPKPDTAFYNNIVNGDFANTFKKAVNGYLGDVSESKKALLLKYLANPNDPSIPDSVKQELKQLATDISEQRNQILRYFENPSDPSIPEKVKTAAKALIEATRTAIVEKYELNPSWQPTVASLTPAGVDPVLYGKALQSVDIVKEILASAKKQIDAMPDGPQKNTYLMFLKMIGLALIALQDAINSMSVVQSEAAKKQSKLKMLMALDNLELKKQEQEDVHEKQGKMAKLGPLGDVMDWVIIVVLVGACFCSPPPLNVLAFLYVTDKIDAKGENKKQSRVEKGFEDMNKELGAYAFIVDLLISMVMGLGNPILMMQLFSKDSRCVQNFVVETCGGSEMAGEITAMVVTTVLMIAMAIAFTVATGGAGAGVAAAQVAETAGAATATTAAAAGSTAATTGAAAAETAAATATFAGKTVEQIQNITMKVLSIVIMCLNVTKEGITLNNQLLLAQIAMIKGKAESQIELIESLISMLKKLIDKLLAMLQGNSEWIVNINQFQGQKWDQASMISSEIAG